MSSTISTTDLKCIPPKALNDLKMDHHRLVRTSSYERIKRFNTFICSQQYYYFLPAIINWLRSSQHSAEATLLTFRSIFFGSFLSETFGEESRNASDSASDLSLFYERCSELLREVRFRSDLVMTSAIYLSCALVFAQFALSVYLVYSSFVPIGLIFLICCMVGIKYLCYKTMFFAARRRCSIKLKYK